MGADIITIFILEWELFYKESKFYHYANLEKKKTRYFTLKEAAYGPAIWWSQMLLSARNLPLILSFACLWVKNCGRIRDQNY
jgi:hypothetical protein